MSQSAERLVKVVMVEGDPGIGGLCKFVLDFDSSCRARTYSDGQSALEAIRQEPPDVVLADVDDMLEFDLVEAIGQEHRDVPVALMCSDVYEQETEVFLKRHPGLPIIKQPFEDVFSLPEQLRGVYQRVQKGNSPQ